MKLQIPDEPKEIKKWMEYTASHDFISPGIEWDPLVVWYGNKLPKYFWDFWKDDLKARGFTWQKFLRLMHYRTDISVLWYKGELPWKKFAAGVIELIEGPIGTGLATEVRPSKQKKSTSP